MTSRFAEQERTLQRLAEAKRFVKERRAAQVKEKKVTKRLEMDAYMTPLPLARAIARRLKVLGVDPKYILEPSAGTGNFARAAHEVWPNSLISIVEPDRKRFDATIALRDEQKNLVCTDGMNVPFEETTQTFLGYPNLILGNPPYSCALEHVRRALRYGHYTAFLLRMSFLASQERVENFWDQLQEQAAGLRWLIPLAQRPSFTGKGTDNSEYAVYVWQQGWVKKAEIDAHLWVE